MKKISSRLTAIAAALLLMTGLPAIAQDAPPDFSTERIGADKPQKPRSPSLQRVLIPAGLLYASFDTDGDYAASPTELAAGILRSLNLKLSSPICLKGLTQMKTASLSLAK